MSDAWEVGTERKRWLQQMISFRALDESGRINLEEGTER